MSFGLTQNGFLVKRLPDIKLEIENGLIGSFGEIDVRPESTFGQLIGVFSKSLADVWELSEVVYNSQYPDTADGVLLDMSSSLVGVTRLAAVATTTIVQFRGADGTVVPALTPISQSVTADTHSTVQAITIQESTVQRTKITVDVSLTQNYVITINGTAITYSSLGISLADIAKGLHEAIENDPTVGPGSTTPVVESEHTLTDSFLVITILNPEQGTTFSVVVGSDLTITDIWTPSNALADAEGEISTPALSVDTLTSPIAGVLEVSNFTAGIVGRNIESDAEYRVRRKVSLGVISAATISSIASRLLQDLTEVSASFVFNNRTDVYDGNGLTTTVYSADMITLNTITFSINGANITPVLFSVDHDTTMELLRLAILALPEVSNATLTDTGGDNRTIEIETGIYNNTFYRVTAPVSVVSGGASQASMTFTTYNTGKPPHSIEAVVAASNDLITNQTIADKLWEVVSGGIETHGNTVATVVDSNGTNQIVKFTHSIIKHVSIRLEYSKAGSDTVFPVSGEALIAEDLLLKGETLTFGSDLLIQYFVGSGYVAGGVTQVTVSISVRDALTDPENFQFNNISISPTDIAKFDSAYITVQEVP